jgi:hypothetical protein
MTTMAAGHKEPEVGFMIFIKPVERNYKNCKAHRRIGWIFSSVTTRLSTLKKI